VHRLVHAPESGNRRIVCRLSDRAAVVTRRRRRVTSFTAALSRDRNRNAPGRRPGRRGGVRVPAAGCARSPVRRLGDVRTGAAARAEARELPFAANVLALGPRRRGLLLLARVKGKFAPVRRSTRDVTIVYTVNV